MSAQQCCETPIVEGERVYLRQLSVADVNGGYLDWINDAEATRFLESRFRQWSREDLGAFIEKDLDGDTAWSMAICRMHDSVHIGNIRLSKIDRHHGNASIGILIGGSADRGQGYGSEAIGLACRIAFDQLGLHRLTAGFYATNSASIAAFQKAGFIEEGRMKGRWLDGSDRVDGVICGITSELWRNGPQYVSGTKTGISR